MAPVARRWLAVVVVVAVGGTLTTPPGAGEGDEAADDPIPFVIFGQDDRDTVSFRFWATDVKNVMRFEKTLWIDHHSPVVLTGFTTAADVDAAGDMDKEGVAGIAANPSVLSHLATTASGKGPSGLRSLDADAGAENSTGHPSSATTAQQQQPQEPQPQPQPAPPNRAPASRAQGNEHRGKGNSQGASDVKGRGELYEPPSELFLTADDGSARCDGPHCETDEDRTWMLWLLCVSMVFNAVVIWLLSNEILEAN